MRLTPALGPAGRGFANAVALVESDLSPPDLLDRLKQVERDFGRRAGRRWGPRVLDLDIILWSQGAWAGDGLTVPHPEFRIRDFVLQPLADVAPAWRDPITGATVRQLRHRLARRA
ncbi:MAG: 2-amino-4-hydroxy-6-hydroxymethyldihydropteridine diphosphokinase [Sphingomonadales bacterium]|nr:2-amino-4-hydroxy-6-hydroxymethyldihydropteridine diphosphokinase [Sphingomonadales bacterium]